MQILIGLTNDCPTDEHVEVIPFRRDEHNRVFGLAGEELVFAGEQTPIRCTRIWHLRAYADRKFETYFERTLPG